MMHNKCENCERVGRGTRRHHIILRINNGSDNTSNRIGLCSVCERFLHYYFKDIIETDLNTREKILSNKEFRLFAEYVNRPSKYKRPVIKSKKIKSIVKDFRCWKKRR